MTLDPISQISKEKVDNMLFSKFDRFLSLLKSYIHGPDLNYSTSKFLFNMNVLLEKYVPLKKISIKESKILRKPWLTKGILNSIRKRDRIRRKWSTSKNSNRTSILWDQFKLYRNQISLLLRISKKNVLKNYFRDNVNNSRKVWAGIRQIINIRSNNHLTPSLLDHNGCQLNNPTDIANAFNTFFTSIDTKLQNKIHSSHIDFYKFLKDPFSIFLSLTVPNDI